MNFSRLAFLLAAGVSIATAATLVFDNFTGNSSITSTSNTPNTYMGDGYVLAPGTTQITGFDLIPVIESATTYTGLQYTVFVWDQVNTGTVDAGSPAFSGLLGTYTGLFGGTFDPGGGFILNITLPVPLSIADTTIGLSFNYQGTTDGVNYASANGLTSGIMFGSPASVGSNLLNGFFRNVNSETDGNFTAPRRSIAQPDQGLAVRVYGNVVPEPASACLLAAGIGLLLLVNTRRKFLRTSRFSTTSHFHPPAPAKNRP